MVTLNLNDLAHILEQIRISEAHTTAIAGGADPRQALADLVTSPLVPYGLRTTSGELNNFQIDMANSGAADQLMSRLLTPSWRVAQDNPRTPGVVDPTSYAQTSGAVYDSQPRTISNLVSDQTLNNPAAISAALAINGVTGAENLVQTGAIYEIYKTALNTPDALTTAPTDADHARALADPAVKTALSAHGITMDGLSVLLGNVATDLGATAPYNSFFTIFGQFFDHGLDLTNKGGAGSVYIALQPDDPLYDPASPANFMVLTRATNQPGPDGLLGTADDIRDNANKTTPWIDLNQLYTSNPSHQVFLRGYVMVDGKPIATGDMLEGQNGGPPTWADVKAQARDMLGIELSDLNVHSVPAVLTDLYGRFIPGANGLPQFVMAGGTTVSGDLVNPIDGALTASAGRAFLDDIAHAAAPGFVDHDRNPATGLVEKLADGDTDTANAQPLNAFGQATTYDNELLDRHFIVGDGRGNENIALTAVHTIFHSEHNHQVDAIKNLLLGSTDVALLNEYLISDLPVNTDLASLTADQKAALIWDGERLFQAARFTTEQVYQHLVFEEFVRAIAPEIDAFVFSNTATIPVAISQEFAQVVYRFGHSMLNEQVDMLSILADTGAVGLSQMPLFDAFLNPVAFDAQGIDAHASAGAILRGMTRQHGNEIDEFLTEALRNNLVGLPLDLGALNMARARDTGIPSLNEARAQFFEQTGDTFLKPYTSWTDFASNLKNPVSIVNFIAAYGEHPTILAATTMEDKRSAACALVFGDSTPETADRLDYLNGTGAWAGVETGLNKVDFWIGGLAEAKMAFGGMLGSTFTFVFETQMEMLQNNDRFYYLSRSQGTNLLSQLESDSFADLIQRNTDGYDLGLSISGSAFSTADWVLEIDQAKQWNAGLGTADPTRAADILSAMTGHTSLVERGANYIKFLGDQHVVLGGTAGADTIVAGLGDDAVWGYDGDDVIEAGYGVDHIHGGEGSDIITDSGTDPGAADVLKGEGGDDLINGGMGIDLVFGGSGSDVIAGGTEAKSVFAGQGDDFVRASAGGGGIYYGNEGDDWLEGQGNMNTLTGDNSELFFNSRVIGHDVMLAGENDTDFDAESGDDIMTAGLGINRFNGMSGFDWVTHKGSDYPVNADMNISLFVNQQNLILRDRFDLVEGLSGWTGDDRLTGREAAAGAVEGANANLPGATSPIASYSNALLEENVDRIDGLRALVSHLQTFTLTQPNTGETKLARMDTGGANDIILGGAGSDVIKGMAGDDIIDGDKWLNVRIEVANDAGTVIGTTDGMTKQIFDIATGTVMFAGKTLEQALFAREVKAANLNIVREILDGDATNSSVDTAMYWDVQSNYTITNNGDGSFTVTHTNQAVGPIDPTTGRALRNEGSDRLTNIEKVQFADGELYIGNVAPTGDLAVSDTTPTEGMAVTVNADAIIDLNGFGPNPMAFQWQASSDSGLTWVDIAGATNTTFTPAQAQVGQLLRVLASYTDAMGYAETVISAATEVVGDNIRGTADPDTLTGTAGADIISALAGADTIFGGAGADTILGGRGNDVISAGDGDDWITWNANAPLTATDGRDAVDGGAGVDTIEVITRNNVDEVFRIYTRAAAVAAGITPGANTEIVITREGTDNASRILLLDNIEEIVIGQIGVTAPTNGTPQGGTANGDQVIVIGDFTQTSLALNTITINGSSADDQVDITALESAHRIVFRTAGGNDVVVGTLRAQDVIEVPAGIDPATYVASDNGDGTVTMSADGHSVTFVGSVDALPTLAPEGTHHGDHAGSTGIEGGSDDLSEYPDSPDDETAGGVAENVPANETDETESQDDGDDESGDDSSDGDSLGSDAASDNSAGSGSDNSVAGAIDGVVLMPGSSATAMVGDAGDDVIVSSASGDALLGKAGADIVLGNEGDDVAVGGSGDDVIEGGAGRDVLLGGDGDDIFIAQNGDGSDMLFGGEGSDTLDLSAVTGGAVIDLGAYTPISTVKSGGVTDYLVGVENVIGSQGADVIKAGLAVNIMTGGEGEDVFVFTSAGTADGDVITDFQVGDKIDLSGIDAVFGSNGNQNFTLADQGVTAAGNLVIREVATADGVDTIIDGYTDGDVDADFSLTLRGAHTLTDSSFTF